MPSIWLLTAAFTLSFSSVPGIAALERGQPAKKLKVVVFGGHPDDPESGAGGLIATLTGLGHEVILAYGTAFRGDRQFFGRPEAEVRRRRRRPLARSWVQPRSSSRMLMKSSWPTRRPRGLFPRGSTR